MKPNLFFCFLLVIFATTVWGQKTGTVVYNNMPDGGIDLTEGWRFSPADNPAFAQPGFGDASWDTIHPTRPLSRLPMLNQVKVGWLRLHFKIGPSLGNRVLLLNVFQNCASEVYLDGKLIKRFGVVSSNPSEVIPIGMNQPTLELHLIPEKEYVFAVRFAVWRRIYLLKNGSSFCWLSLTDFPHYENATRTIDTGNTAYILLFSVFSLLSLLHLAFYRYDSKQRANLFFAVYAINTAAGFLLVIFQGYVEDARAYALVFTPAFLLTLMGGIWVVKALGCLFGFSIRRLVITLWIVYVIAVFLIIVNDDKMPFFAGIILFLLVQLWFTGKALWAKKRGAGIIGAGFLVSVIGALYLASALFLGEDTGILMYQASVVCIFLAPALGISLYLAREFALGSSLLREKLVQVENLSALTLLQEQEKQQILARNNDELEKQVSARTMELQNSLQNLKSAQTRLIQSEKMASLGELTAGIAHEIQNPLNFVNNFSEVSRELLTELKEEFLAGNREDVLAITADLDQNLEKITHHGKRADAIVKGMLQHSRAGGGVKELTDINKLADEYLRLAYHGLKAKDKAFNATLNTSFQEGLPAVNMVPQDIGRVLLNVYNNAFYAVQQKQKTAGDDYKPEVSVNTLNEGEWIRIEIRDNGDGIPEAIKEKIMQPFFTTKPTGEGTGLGLSLSYDIIVKGHNGTLEVNSTEGEFTAFVISIPIL